MDTAKPQRVASQGKTLSRRRKQQTGATAVLMGEAVFPEMPQQYRDPVRPLAQERGDVHPVVIRTAGRRAPFQSPFENDALAVDPQPVFRIGRNAHRRDRRQRLQLHIAPERDPAVRTIRPLLRRADPTGAGTLPERSAGVLQRQEREQAKKSPDFHGTSHFQSFYNALNTDLLSRALFGPAITSNSPGS